MTPGTTLRNIRVHDQLWTQAKAKAQTEGTDLSTVIRDYLTIYVGTPASEDTMELREKIAATITELDELQTLLKRLS